MEKCGKYMNKSKIESFSIDQVKEIVKGSLRCNKCSGVEKWSSRRPHKSEIEGSNPSRRNFAGATIPYSVES